MEADMKSAAMHDIINIAAKECGVMLGSKMLASEWLQFIRKITDGRHKSQNGHKV